MRYARRRGREDEMKKIPAFCWMECPQSIEIFSEAYPG